MGLLRYLSPDVPIQRTCAPLVHAAEETLTCEEASRLSSRRVGTFRVDTMPCVLSNRFRGRATIRDAMTEERQTEPLARRAYEELAEAYAALAPTKPHNAYYERPATLSLLGEVRGRRVLDAGCGPGVYAEILDDHGAEVVGFDASEKMVALALDRLRGRAQFFRANLEDAWDPLEDASFDLALSALAMDYVGDWSRPLSEFYRVLRPGGRLVFSVEHHTSTFVRHVYKGDGNYFETEAVGMEWTGFPGRVWVPSYERPLETMVGAILASGFELVGLVEPRPDGRFKRADPDGYEKLSRMPGFLCLEARKPGTRTPRSSSARE